MSANSNELNWAHPLVQEWFIKKFHSPTEPQKQGWPPILANTPTLISAPTGSGKTFAAFLTCIDDLVRKSLKGELKDITEVVYVSPLKALGNDIQKNLNEPLQEIYDLAKSQHLKIDKINVAVRSGDTPANERQAMLKKPPHILVTTPESLYILLTAEKSRQILTHVKTVIVDEIHAMANDKRGTHLALSLERLEAITAHPPVRIGLSATQKPIENVAHFLMGNRKQIPAIINIGHSRQLDLAIEVPQTPLSAVASNEMWDEMYDRIATLAKENRSTLIFVNTRRLAERVAHHLAERLGEEKVATHHGSLSRKLRLEAENRLKSGKLQALVATASLELGIDIGSIDLVCQLGSPRAIAVALQRIGRAGHWRDAVSKGRIFATTRDELIECAALVKAIREGDLDQLIFPDEPLDILCQQIIAETAARDWHEDDLFNLVKKTYHYKNLSREKFNSIIEMLSEGIAGSRGRYSAYLYRDQVNSIVKARRGARLTAITSGGAIPDNGLFTMISEPDEVMVGTLDEDFAVESNRGDIILLGTTSWRINRVESTTGRVMVEDAHGAPPSVPFWRGEAPGRTLELSIQVAKLRQDISDQLSIAAATDDDASVTDATVTSVPTDEPTTTGTAAATTATVTATADDTTASATEKQKNRVEKWLMKHCKVSEFAAKQMIDYILQGRAVLGAVPTQKTLIAERFFDESGGMQLIIHAPFGSRINKAWGFALRKRFCRSFNFELQAAATEDGLNISLAEQHSFPLSDVFHFLNAKTVKEVLTQAVLQSPLFTTRWRWDTTRALALVRFRNGKKVPPNIQRMRSDDLLAAVFPDAAACQDNLGGKDIELPDHPLINETMKDALHEALDLDGLIAVLQGIQNGTIQCLAVDTPLPSVFAHEILNANPYAFLDDAPLEERRARAVEMRSVLPEAVLNNIGKLDPAAITEVQKQAWPDIRNADELHDALQTLIAFPVNQQPNKINNIALRVNESADMLRLHDSPYTENLSFSAESQDTENLHFLTESQYPKILLFITESQVAWQLYFDELVKNHRATIATYRNKQFWVAAEKIKTFSSIYPDATFANVLKDIPEHPLNQDEAQIQMLRSWLQHLGPTTKIELQHILNLEICAIDTALLQLESTGLILRGHFRSIDVIEWCERRLLARIHRLTLDKLRKEIEPVSIPTFHRWLSLWQHVAPGTQLQGEQGLLEIIKQLQGFEIPANAWEHDIFAKRVSDYNRDMLDTLCRSGVIGWGRLSTVIKSSDINSLNPKALDAKSSDTKALNTKALDAKSLNTKLSETKFIKRIKPTSVSPITFFVREESDWMHLENPHLIENHLIQLSHAAKNIYAFLKQRGASFFSDITRHVKNLKAEIEMGLWELIAAGIITADDFDNLRALIDSRRRTDKRRRRSQTRFSMGRWSILYPDHGHTDRNTQIEAACWMLLKRYGVVFRDLILREKNIPSWRDLLIMYRKLEERGEIRGGRFVNGFRGEQFALPYAVESLRAMRNHPLGDSISISAVDPLNLTGIISGERVSAVSGKTIKI